MLTIWIVVGRTECGIQTEPLTRFIKICFGFHHFVFVVIHIDKWPQASFHLYMSRRNLSTSASHHVYSIPIMPAIYPHYSTLRTGIHIHIQLYTAHRWHTSHSLFLVSLWIFSSLLSVNNASDAKLLRVECKTHSARYFGEGWNISTAFRTYIIANLMFSAREMVSLSKVLLARRNGHKMHR